MAKQTNRIKVKDRDFLVSDEDLYYLEMAKKKKVRAEMEVYDFITEQTYHIQAVDGQLIGYKVKR